MTESALPARLKLHAMSARTLGVFQGGALGKPGDGHGVNRQGALFGSFLGCFFQYVFGRLKNQYFSAFLVFVWPYLVISQQILRSFWALFGAFFEKQRFLENRCFS